MIGLIIKTIQLYSMRITRNFSLEFRCRVSIYQIFIENFVQIMILNTKIKLMRHISSMGCYFFDWLTFVSGIQRVQPSEYTFMK